LRNATQIERERLESQPNKVEENSAPATSYCTDSGPSSVGCLTGGIAALRNN
ncbi:hypothetical protein PanWU01x14_109400, partial [Parasponia andersonii]